ncbi:MAG TPA: LUD domain-containing protein [Gemmataceae bacterium]|nr:LUD domain-containing protein [Gemmataceae bacterium]
MSARDAILRRVRAALDGDPDFGPPPSYELWPEGTWPPPDDLFARFVEELQRVQGEGRRFATVEDARQFVQALHAELGGPRTVVVDHPRCRAVGDAVPHHEMLAPAMDRERLAAIRLGVLPAEFLLADTGTAILLPRSHAERLLCYLPEVTVVVAGPGSVVAHLSDVWERITAAAKDVGLRGEMVLVTGPSRTADIEKKLVLGAHGPKRLVALLLDERV